MSSVNLTSYAKGSVQICYRDKYLQQKLDTNQNLWPSQALVNFDRFLVFFSYRSNRKTLSSKIKVTDGQKADGQREREVSFLPIGYGAFDKNLLHLLSDKVLYIFIVISSSIKPITHDEYYLHNTLQKLKVEVRVEG